MTAFDLAMKMNRLYDKYDFDNSPPISLEDFNKALDIFDQLYNAYQKLSGAFMHSQLKNIDVLREIKNVENEFFVEED